MKIGCHLSSSGGYLAMAQTAESIGANVFQFFTRNPRGGAAKPLDLDDARRFMEFAAGRGIGPILDLKRLEATPGAMYNFHPGSHVGQGAEKGIELISSLLKRVFGAMRGGVSTTVLLETMSGKGSEVGRDFGELRKIIDAAGLPLGVCLDTCHVWDGGYDIVDDLDGVLAAFDREIGLDRLKAVHVNDSMNVLGAHKDRHEKIGGGFIGLEGFRRIINCAAARDLPFYLETPCDLEGYAAEIALLKSIREV